MNTPLVINGLVYSLMERSFSLQNIEWQPNTNSSLKKHQIVHSEAAHLFTDLNDFKT